MRPTGGPYAGRSPARRTPCRIRAARRRSPMLRLFRRTAARSRLAVSRSSAVLEDAGHALVADLEALRPERVSNSPELPLLSPWSGNFSDSLLLRLNRNERAVGSHIETKGHVTAEKAPPGLLVGFRLSDSRTGSSLNAAATGDQRDIGRGSRWRCDLDHLSRNPQNDRVAKKPQFPARGWRARRVCGQNRAPTADRTLRLSQPEANRHN
jgi:hypothetical protein